MSQIQVAPVSTASAFLQSLGFELTLFVVTIVLAVAFRGVGKKTSSSKSLKPKVTLADERAQHDDSLGHKKQAKYCAPTPAQDLTPAKTDLELKVDSMISCASRRRFPEAIALYDEIKATCDNSAFQDALKCGKHRPVDVFNLLVQCAGRVGRPDLILAFIDDMTSAGFERPLAFYETTMKMLASKKCYREALCVCSRLEADGLEPSPVTLSCLVSFAVEVGEPDRAISFFERLAACSMPSIRAYMTILRVYSRRQNWSQCLALVRDMQRRHAPIDSLVLNIVLATGVAAGELEAAKELLEEFSLAGTADVISYNTVMKGLAQQKNGDDAIKLLHEMCQAKVTPNAITFNTCMDATIRSANIVDAWQVLSQMVLAGVSPDKFTCTTLMKGLQHGATSAQLSVILDLLRSVAAQCDPALSSSLFRSVIQATAQVNDPGLTARAVAQMREQQVILPSQDYQQLLQVLMRGSNTKHHSADRRQAAFPHSMKSVCAW